MLSHVVIGNTAAVKSGNEPTFQCIKAKFSQGRFSIKWFTNNVFPFPVMCFCSCLCVRVPVSYEKDRLTIIFIFITFLFLFGCLQLSGLVICNCREKGFTWQTEKLVHYHFHRQFCLHSCGYPWHRNDFKSIMSNSLEALHPQILFSVHG